jgi:tyrosinase
MSNGSPENEQRARRDVQSLLADGEDGRKVLDDYATAIDAMRQRDSDTGDDLSDPLSWRFQAAIHGLAGVPATVDHPNSWSACRHFSWFFLPWHRVYLFFFERIVQFHLEDETWSLPYWDYTKPDDDSSRILPEPFRTPTDGNALHTDQRDPRVNHETNPRTLPYARRTDAMPALMHRDFAVTGDDASGSFGGGVVEDTTPNVGPGGSVENVPHGAVHMLVGGDFGWMADFNTAALDPIFWLHHCNLDRLWDVWIAHYGEDALPSDSAFLETEFEFFDSDGTRKSMAIGDILQSADLGYVYESTDPPEPIPEPEPVTPFGLTGEAEVPRPEPVGAASDVPFAARSTVGIDLEPAASRGFGVAGEEPKRWFLRLEDVSGERLGAAAGYDVYLNLPEGESGEDHPERRAGSLAGFGIREASSKAAEHGGTGVTQVFDITPVVSALKDGEGWDASSVGVTIVPVDVEGEVEEGGDVRAGRISIYAA